MLYVGIDLGTYLCRFILAESKKSASKNDKIENRFNVLSYNTCVVNFGNMEPGKDITKQTLVRIDRIFDKFKQYIDEHKNSEITVKCVATAALRYSPKAQEVIDRVYRKYGIQIHVIPSEYEIYLAALGCQDQVDKEAIVLDIGSGSTEIAYITKNGESIKVHDYISLDLGLINNGTVKTKRQEALDQLEAFIGKYRNLPVICSKCNTLKIAHNYYHKKHATWVEGKTFKLDELSHVLKLFNKMDMPTLKKIPSVGAKKVRLIKCGLPWVYVMLKQMRVDSIVLSEYGLKEGIVLSMMDHSNDFEEYMKQYTKMNEQHNSNEQQSSDEQQNSYCAESDSTVRSSKKKKPSLNSAHNHEPKHKPNHKPQNKQQNHQKKHGSRDLMKRSHVSTNAKRDASANQVQHQERQRFKVDNKE